MKIKKMAGLAACASILSIIGNSVLMEDAVFAMLEMRDEGNQTIEAGQQNETKKNCCSCKCCKRARFADEQKIGYKNFRRNSKSKSISK
ncbi:MAG: hypothetical protein LBB21_05095 [Holosporaceae bacterium]|nr:hypothetical protein [Holosporaceae bacterium]